MYLVIVIAFALLLMDDLPPPGWDLIHRALAAMGRLEWHTGLTWGLVACQVVAPAILARILARRALAAVDGTEAGNERLEDRHWRSSMVLAGSVLGLLTLVFVGSGWLPLVREAPVLRRFGLLADLAAIGPCLLSIIAAWAAAYPAERAVRGVAVGAEHAPQAHRWTLRYYLSYKTRHQILTVLVPMFFVLAAKHAVDYYRVPIIRFVRVGWAPDSLIGLCAACVLILSPVMLRYLWVTRPLPPGDLRDRLEALCRRVGLRCQEILIWESQELVINAAVTGLFTPVRYVFLSDGLLASMSESQIEAVFGHEAGHVRRHHLWYFGVFALLSMLAVGGLLELLARHAALSNSLLQAIGLVAMPLAWSSFGYVSRKFERQADLYGVQCVTAPAGPCDPGCLVHDSAATLSSTIKSMSDVVTAANAAAPQYTAAPTAPGTSSFISAARRTTPRDAVCIAATRLFGRTLLDVAHLNGIPIEAPSWRHGSVQSRCELLREFARDPQALKRFERGVKLLKISLALLTAIGCAIACKLYWPF